MERGATCVRIQLIKSAGRLVNGVRLVKVFWCVARRCLGKMWRNAEVAKWGMKRNECC